MLSCHSMNMTRLRQLSNVIQVPLQQPNLAYKVFHWGGSGRALWGESRTSCCAPLMLAKFIHVATDMGLEVVCKVCICEGSDDALDRMLCEHGFCHTACGCRLVAIPPPYARRVVEPVVLQEQKKGSPNFGRS